MLDKNNPNIWYTISERYLVWFDSVLWNLFSDYGKLLIWKCVNKSHVIYLSMQQSPLPLFPVSQQFHFINIHVLYDAGGVQSYTQKHTHTHTNCNIPPLLSVVGERLQYFLKQRIHPLIIPPTTTDKNTCSSKGTFVCVCVCVLVKCHRLHFPKTLSISCISVNC